MSFPVKMNTWPGVVLILIAMGLSGCVTKQISGPDRQPDPEKALRSFVQLGLGYIQNGEYKRARENLNRALELDSNSAEAYNAFGLLYDVQGETELAEKNFKKALTFGGESSQFHNNYGAFLFSRERYPEAIQQLELASTDPFYRARPQVFENLGVCYLQIDQVDKAEAAFFKSVSLNPRQARALLELGDIYFDQRDYVKSNEFFRRYLKVGGHSARSLWLGIRLARIFSKPDEEASLELMLKNIFPASDEFKKLMATP